MQRIRPSIPVTVLMGVFLFASAAFAAGACLDEARLDFRDCKQTCRDDSQAAKDACLNRDHACVEVCRADRSECSDAVGLDGARDLCAAQLHDARQVCRALFPPDTAGRDGCIDQAQVVSFVCRDDARELAKPLLRECRADFRLCGRACGPPDPAEPVDVPQCRSAATDQLAACQVTCAEDYQVAKDVCKNRDHECVEECRAVRQACKAPILDSLELALDGCQQTRDAAVQNCRTLYLPDSVELDSCIDVAQVEAFQCRDAARELMRPQLEICRQGFGDCVSVCPAPAP